MVRGLAQAAEASHSLKVVVVVETFFNKNFDSCRTIFGNERSKTKYSIGVNGVLLYTIVMN